MRMRLPALRGKPVAEFCGQRHSIASSVARRSAAAAGRSQWMRAIRRTQRQTRAAARGTVKALKRDFDHQFRGQCADRAKALGRVVADEAVKLLRLVPMRLVGQVERRHADRHQRIAVPQAKQSHGTLRLE